MGLFLKASHGNSFSASAAAAAVEREKVMGTEVDVERLFIPALVIYLLTTAALQSGNQ